MPPNEAIPTVTELTSTLADALSAGEAQASPVETRQAPITPQRNVVTMTQEQLRAHEKRQQEKGHKAALRMLDDQARSAGFKDFQHMKNKTERRAASTSTSKPAKPSEPHRTFERSHGEASPKWEQRLAQAQEERRKANRRAANAEKRTKVLERTMHARDAESHLRLLAMQAGVSDVDYAIVLLKRLTHAMPPDALTTFDENKFFSDVLRKSHPYLYGIEERVAHTTPAGSQDAPAAPSASRVSKESTSSMSKDAREMTPDEFNKRLKELGLEDPSTGIMVPN